MVCGLVQKQKIGLGQQQLGQRDAHLPAAAEFIGLPRPIFLAEAEAGEHAAHLRVERVAVERVKAVLQQRVALGGGLVLGAFVVEFGHLRQPAARSRAPFRAISSKTVRHSSKTVRPASSQPLLRQVADADAAGLLERAVVQRLESGEHLHQRGFAGAVGAHERGFFVVADEPVGLKKQHARAEPLSGILEREHSLYFRKIGLRRRYCPTPSTMKQHFQE